jgi:hypothetical protein
VLGTGQKIATGLVLATALILAPRIDAAPAHRRALLIGINDYSASRLASIGPPVPGRVWSNLDGALNDVALMRELLLKKRGFAADDIVVLTDQQATRAAILDAIDQQLVGKAKKGDVVLFYYSGHGSQVRNTKSDEDDQLDESIVPADSSRGTPDIRDKELRARFNAVLDRGVQLTVVLDSCHSASGVRGFDGGAHFRALGPDDRDVADPSRGPRPEDRGALVFAAAQDFDLAYETIDHGTIRGAFSWALARALRDAPADEPAEDTFARVEARLRVEMPAQQPVIAGNRSARQRPFLAAAAGASPAVRAVIAIERRLPSGEYTLRGGWINGLTDGTRLRLPGDAGLRLEVTSLTGVSKATARLVGETKQRRAPLAPGTLLEIATWAPPPGQPLRVCIPRGSMADELRDLDGVELVAGAAFADYVLADHRAADGVEYAWIRPGTTASDDQRATLPTRTEWIPASQPAAASALRELLTRLERVHGWQELDSPPGPSVPYRLAVRRDRDGALIAAGGTLTGDESYHLLLLPRGDAPIPLRYVYVFVVDSSGGGVLLFPPPNIGFVENRIPVTGRKSSNRSQEIPLGSQPFTVDSPYGRDTYFLLTTDEPLNSLASLHWDSVRGPQIVPHSELERLFVATASGTRSDSGTFRTPPHWSIDKVIFDSVPPRRNPR